MLGVFIAVSTIINAAHQAAELKRLADERQRQSEARCREHMQAWEDSKAGVIDLRPEDVRVVREPKLLES